ncbi:uncharacterized protein C10orf95-like [Onychostruthus taczanowskii]|uniref:uncharacterized protein C10orf95-like n=1 Tax=Onychostruthus taczanowskii TaxID=356909 RepID=UPI001B803FD0|nr:uncharacterized protein C10orf95-like [Onychostruthus taczanowskii]
MFTAGGRAGGRTDGHTHQPHAASQVIKINTSGKSRRMHKLGERPAAPGDLLHGHEKIIRRIRGAAEGLPLKRGGGRRAPTGGAGSTVNSDKFKKKKKIPTLPPAGCPSPAGDERERRLRRAGDARGMRGMRGMPPARPPARPPPGRSPLSAAASAPAPALASRESKASSISNAQERAINNILRVLRRSRAEPRRGAARPWRAGLAGLAGRPLSPASLLGVPAARSAAPAPASASPAAAAALRASARACREGCGRTRESARFPGKREKN